MHGRLALVRRPGPRLAEGLTTHIDPSPIDLELAHEQWVAYVQALRAADWEVLEVAGDDECPDAVFVEDTVVVYGDLAVISRPGAPSRMPETAPVERTLRALGYRIAHIEEPGTLDGGDVLKHDGVVWVGQGGRTNAEGARQLAAHLEPLGARVVPVEVTKALHLKTVVTALPDGSVIGYPPLVDDESVWPTFTPVEEEAGAHVVLLGEGRVLMAASAPKTAEAFAARGLTPVVVDISEFEKLEGCVTCLSVRLRR